MTPRRVLITGGAGFLGSHLAGRLAEAGLGVRLLDLTGADAPKEVPVELVRGDVRDPRAVTEAVRDVEVVVHAAFASPRQTPDVIQSVNVGGTRNVCEQALAHGVRRLVLISSTIVTRRLRAHPFSPNSPLTRLDQYRRSRVDAEAVAAEYRPRGLQVVVVRPKTFVGPQRIGAFAIIFEWVRLGRPIIVLGNGRNRYQLLDARDMAEGLSLLAASHTDGLFLFGAREFRTVGEDLQTLLDHAGTGARLRFIPALLARTALRGMELANVVPASEWHYMTAFGQDSIVDISRAERELGWRPVKSNAQALIDAYDWYVRTIRATGHAATTHPVPLVHRALKRLNWLLPK